MKALSRKPVTKDNAVEALNLEIIPLLRELRAGLLRLEALSGTVPLHAQEHEFGESDPIEGALISVLYAPTNYIAALDILLAHLAGIDAELSPYLVYTSEGASHIFVLDDQFTTIVCVHVGAVTHLLPLTTTVPYPVGTVLRFLWRGTGQPTIGGEVGVNVVAPDGAKVSALNKFAFAEKLAGDTWILSGSLAV